MQNGEKRKTIVITGSTRGIGFALAKAFCSKGCGVVVSGRKKKDVNAAVAALNAGMESELAAGTPCDVTRPKELDALWKFAIEQFGAVDVWINNAGISNQLNFIADIPEEEVRRVIETNMLGEIYGTQVALRGFQKQGYGALYNMEGMGAKKGRMVDGLSIYGTTKAGLRYFNDAIAQESKDPKIMIGALLPGMVLTDMVTRQYEGDPEGWQRVEGVFDAIAEDVDVVAAWLANKILLNQKNGVRLAFSHPLKIMLRMFKYGIQKNRKKDR